MAVLLTLRFPRWLAFTLLGLFAAQFAFPGQAARYLLCAIYGAIALVALIRNRLADPARPGRPVPHSARPLPGASPRARARGRAAAQSEPVEDLSDLPADASDAAAGCSPPRTRS